MRELLCFQTTKGGVMGGIPVLTLMALLVGMAAMMLMQGRPRREKVAIGIPAIAFMGYALVTGL